MDALSDMQLSTNICALQPYLHQQICFSTPKNTLLPWKSLLGSIFFHALCPLAQIVCRTLFINHSY